MGKLLQLLTAVLICESVGIISAFLTLPSIPTWYTTLNKPAFSPPAWIFAPVWTALYALMGTAAYLVWEKRERKKEAKSALLIFIFQLGLNFAWSLLFFGLHSPILALLDIVLLWLAIAATMFKFNKISPLASCLFIPYLIWVSFASILNISIVFLNP